MPDLEILERARSRSTSLDEPRVGVQARIGGVQAVDVGQQDQLVGGDQHRDLRREEVVVAEGDLIGRGRVVLVDHRQHPPLEQRA